MNTTLIPWINERIKIMENFFALWIYSSVLDRGEGEGKSIRRLNLTIENVARSRGKRSTKSTTHFSLLVRFANWELNSFVRRWNVCTRRRGRGGGAIGEKNCAWTHGTREVEQPRGNWRRLSPFGYAKKNKKGNNEPRTSDPPTTKRCENRIQRVSLWRRRKRRRRIEFVIYDYAVQLLVKTSFRKNGGYFDFLFFHNA